MSSLTPEASKLRTKLLAKSSLVSFRHQAHSPDTHIRSGNTRGDPRKGLASCSQCPGWDYKCMENTVLGQRVGCCDQPRSGLMGVGAEATENYLNLQENPGSTKTLG